MLNRSRVLALLWIAGCSVSPVTFTPLAGDPDAGSVPDADNRLELRVTLAGDSQGIVVSDPAGISCGATCTAKFPPGTMVTLTAMPTGAPSSFAGWSPAMCPGTGTCTQVLVDATTPITATFTRHASATFTASGVFAVPPGVTSVHVLVVGGGGGGANGHQGGGGSGVVATTTVAVTPGGMVPITVGAAGLGAKVCDGCNEIVGNTPGGMSSFGSFLTAIGGLTSMTINGPGGAGGSGGGGSCNAGSPGGAGGTAGASGGACTYTGGAGQGDFTAALTAFTVHALTPAPGGAGGVSSHSAGGGGGGVYLDGAGATGADGAAAFSGKGGRGYGGGGGAGGYDGATSNLRYAGGNGAPGLVYVEW